MRQIQDESKKLYLLELYAIREEYHQKEHSRKQDVYKIELKKVTSNSDLMINSSKIIKSQGSGKKIEAINNYMVKHETVTSDEKLIATLREELTKKEDEKLHDYKSVNQKILLKYINSYKSQNILHKKPKDLFQHLKEKTDFKKKPKEIENLVLPVQIAQLDKHNYVAAVDFGFGIIKDRNLDGFDRIVSMLKMKQIN